MCPSNQSATCMIMSLPYRTLIFSPSASGSAVSPSRCKSSSNRVCRCKLHDLKQHQHQRTLLRATSGFCISLHGGVPSGPTARQKSQNYDKGVLRNAEHPGRLLSWSRRRPAYEAANTLFIFVSLPPTHLSSRSCDRSSRARLVIRLRQTTVPHP